MAFFCAAQYAAPEDTTYIKLPPDVADALEAFDQYYERELIRAKIHSSLLPGNVDFETTPYRRDEIQHNIGTADIDRQVRYDTIREIFKGPRNIEADLEASAKQLSDYYQPKLERIERLFTILEEHTSDS